MTNRPVIVRAARGVRGRYTTVETIPDEEVPCGTSWFYAKHKEWQGKGYTRIKVLVYSDIRHTYMQF